MHTRAWVLLGPFAVLVVANCAPILDSAAKTERSIAASCTAWEERAKKAAHPDAGLIARHDQLMAKAVMFEAEARAKYSDTPARRAAIENEVQAKLDAAAIYDWRYDLQVASQCWRDLAITQEDHREQQEKLERLTEQLAVQSTVPQVPAAMPIYIPRPQSAGIVSPPPVAVMPTSKATAPAPVQTWGETPCAPMIPPAMRDQPISNVNAMIPPACR
jgi:hypothetical protein